MMHTILIIISVWESVIVNFDKPELMDLIPKWVRRNALVWAIIYGTTALFRALGVRTLCCGQLTCLTILHIAFCSHNCRSHLPRPLVCRFYIELAVIYIYSCAVSSRTESVNVSSWNWWPCTQLNFFQWQRSGILLHPLYVIQPY